MKVIFNKKTNTIEIDFEGAKLVSYNPADGVIDHIKSNVNLSIKRGILSKRYLSDEQYEKHMEKFPSEGKNIMEFQGGIKDKIIIRKEI